jgi:hypothetical protein
VELTDMLMRYARHFGHVPPIDILDELSEDELTEKLQRAIAAKKPVKRWAGREEDWCEWDLQLSDVGEEVFWQDWDSGGPGAGAGRVSVYRYGKDFYVEHDAGIEGPYKSKEEAADKNGVSNINDATEAIWDIDRGYIFTRRR